MKRYKKFILFGICFALIIGVSYGAYYLFHYVLYDEYKESFTSYDYEEGKEFQALEDSNPSVSGMVLGAENEYLKLYTNVKTAEIAVYDKRTGEITYSNPQKADEDSVASGVNKSMLKSQIIIDYFNASRVGGSYNSYDYSTTLGQFELEAIHNGFRYTYTIGDLSSATGIAPMFITEERLESFLSNLDEKSAKYIAKRYSQSGKVDGFLELNEAAKTGASTLRKINEYLTAAGYTIEDYEMDMVAAGAEAEMPISFVVPLEYRLSEDGIDVSIPTCKVEEHGGGFIFRIQVLRYFAAAGTEEEGYFLVPNGSGSLIHFNNGKTKTQDYSQFVYGLDPLLSQYLVLENTENARLPLFGISRKNSGILATIEEGESLAAIYASVAGKINSYNYAYSEFQIRGYDTLSMFGQTGAAAELPILEKKFYDVNLTVKYTFLDKNYADYSGMARYFRERLEREGVLQTVDKTESIPFYMDVVGGVGRTGFFLGKQYGEIYPMTTFKEAGNIVEELHNNGVTNLIMNYQGWFNGGYYHDVASKIKVLRKLGGKSGLNALTNKVESFGGSVYGEVAFQKVPFTSDRYKYDVESSKYYGSGYVVNFGQVNPMTYYQSSSLGYIETKYFVLSPKYLPRYINKFTNKIMKYNISGVTLKDLGDYLQSDKKRTEGINREQAKHVVMDQFEKLEATNKNIMVNGGNFYSLTYSDDVINAPIGHNSYPIVDEEVPFYEMVIHGLVNYSGSAINLMDTYKKDDFILRLIEYGASPHYTFTSKDSSEMKYTGLNMLHSTQFSIWKEDAIEVYQKVNEALKYVTNAKIINHEIISDGFKKVSYDNGVVFYINQSSKDLTYEGITVTAKSYEMEGLGE